MMTELQREVPKMACIVSKTTNITAKVFADINQEVGGLRITVLQNSYCRLFTAQA